MDARRFEALLNAYGGEPRRWPAPERLAAEAFGRTTEGRAMLAGALAVDDWLNASTSPQPSRVLHERVLEAAPRPGIWTTLASLLGRARAWAPGAGLAAAGLAGVLFGAALSDSSSDVGVELLLAEAGPYDETLMLERTP